MREGEDADLIVTDTIIELDKLTSSHIKKNHENRCLLSKILRSTCSKIEFVCVAKACDMSIVSELRYYTCENVVCLQIGESKRISILLWNLPWIN